MKKKRNLTLIGHYCATGGISIHIRRLEQLLKQSFNISIIDESRIADNDGFTYNLRRKRFIKYISLINKADIVHIHTTISILKFLHVFFARALGKKVVLTVHSLSTIKNKRDLWFLKFTIGIASKVIVVSEEIKKKIGSKKVTVLPAFLPAEMAAEPELPEEISKIISDIKKRNFKVIVSNAYRLNFHKNEDLYGLDLLLNVARTAKKNKKDLFIIFVITSLEVNKEVFKNYCRSVEKEELSNYIKFIPYSLSFVKLIEKCDLVVRATNTDGDALTVREGLYLKKPVIASDVVTRPEGTILFQTRDSEDLYLKILRTLNASHRILPTSKINYFEAYRDIYI